MFKFATFSRSLTVSPALLHPFQGPTDLTSGNSPELENMISSLQFLTARAWKVLIDFDGSIFEKIFVSEIIANCNMVKEKIIFCGPDNLPNVYGVERLGPIGTIMTREDKVDDRLIASGTYALPISVIKRGAVGIIHGYINSTSYHEYKVQTVPSDSKVEFRASELQRIEVLGYDLYAAQISESQAMR
ncbi:hypothetical protein NE237_008182 [Protea cynaroides]|uniref:Uncharacterized protein n=1 Tax=Protea cynaroides TaxID=273540 RepID=A0A9Q0KQK6_9MAGN|nr:hypothetical protein NE237_008182 [Protea cynaroides]